MARRKRNGNRGNGNHIPTPKKRWHDDLRPETKKSILAIVFFAFSLITILAYWGRAGFFGSIIFRALELAVGKAYFLAPVTFFFVGASLLFRTRQGEIGNHPSESWRHLYAGVLVGAILFFISGLALIELFFQNKTGGWIGFLANWPLERTFDFWAAMIIEFALFAASILIMVNIPLLRPRRTEDEETSTVEKALDTVHMAASVMKEAIQKKPDQEEALAVAESAKPKPISGDEFTILAKRHRPSTYVPPPLSLLNDDKGTPSSGDIRANANIIKRTLLNFGIDVEMGEVSVGPTVTQYTLKPAEGVKLARIVALQNDLSLALAAHPIRLEAPIPGRSLVGVEVPNRSIALVGLRSLFENDAFQQSSASLLLALGRDVAGTPVYANLAKMPHLLVAGATGAGKSVAIHSIITSFLYRNGPDMLRFLMIDPKRVELSIYSGVPHLLTPPITDAKKAVQALHWATKEMEKRYEVLSANGVRDIGGYNERAAKKKDGELMPYIVIVVDELADLMMNFQRPVEAAVVRIAQMARAVGIHLIISTQRPSVEIITGLIKANITSRIAFQVASQIDSRTILDAAGADKLLGNGDMLFLAGDTAKPRRIQGGFVSEGEVQRVVKFIQEHADLLPADEAAGEDIFATAGNQLAEALTNGGGDEYEGDEDPLYEDAKATVIAAGKASASYLQRRLKIGYARAARLLDILEERGVIGPGEGAKPREIFMKGDEVSEV